MRHTGSEHHALRYPHRSAVLGRACSAEELALLSEPGYLSWLFALNLLRFL